MSQMNPKEVFHKTLHTKFNYLTLPVTPLNVKKKDMETVSMTTC